MTAAQALAPGLSSPSSPRPSASGGDGGGERGGASFRDTLDRASKGTPDAASGSRKRGSDATRSNADAATAGNAGETNVSAQSPAPVSPPQAQAAQPQHGGAAGAAGQSDAAAARATSLVARLQAMLGQGDATAQAGEDAEGGPMVPGMVEDDGEVFDAARLLAIMRSDGARAANAAGGATVVTVLGQERHLALARMSPELASALAKEQDLAATLRGEANAASPAAALPPQADVSGEGLERTRGKTDGDEIGRVGTDPGTGRRGALFAAEGRGQSGGGLGEPGQEGRQQDGRNAGTNGQPMGATFASAMQGAGLEATNAARGMPGVALSHDPVGDQIAARIRSELVAGGRGETSSEGVVKVLNLELKPANLGAVTVRMQLKDNVISIHVEAQHAETRALIEREQAKLTSALSAAGYTVETITAVQGEGVRTGGLAAPGDTGSASFQEPGNQNPGSRDSSDDERSGRRPASGDPQRSGSGGHDDTAAAARKGVDGVYV